MQEFLEALIKGRYRTNWVHQRHLPAEPARFQEPARPLHPDLAEALASRGIPRLYTHQAAALDALQRGEHVYTWARFPKVLESGRCRWMGGHSRVGVGTARNCSS